MTPGGGCRRRPGAGVAPSAGDDLAIYGIGLAHARPDAGAPSATLDAYRKQPASFGCTLVPRRAPDAPRAGCDAEPSATTFSLSKAGHVGGAEFSAIRIAAIRAVAAPGKRLTVAQD